MGVNIEDVLTDSLTACVSAWFETDCKHPFLSLQTIVVPDSEKPIPKRWIEDVELGLEDGLEGNEEDDIMGAMPVVSWSHEIGRKRLEEALVRLDLREDQLSQPKVNRRNKHELGAEKRRVKQELKRYDVEFRKQFMRLPTHSEKEPMRPLYIYYRRLKAMLAQAEQQSKAASGQRGSLSDDEGGRGSLDDLARNRGGSGNLLEDRISAAEARIDSLQREKTAVRQKLQAFQEKFLADYNRKIRFHKDILPIEKEYRMYKQLKDDIMRAEGQLRDLTASANA